MNRFRWSTGVALLSVVAALGIAVSTASSNSSKSSQRAAAKAITPSPVWTRKQLNAPAADDWINHYGSLTGTRYSSLKQITTANVSGLKQVWQMSLGTCTAGVIAGNPAVPGAPRGAANNPTNCGSMEANPVAVNGILYTINPPLGQVFAIDATNGAIIWTYTPSYAGEFLNNGEPVLRPATVAAWPVSRSPRARSSSASRTAV